MSHERFNDKSTVAEYLFVGRKTELRQFRQALGRHGLLQRFLRRPGRGVRSRVFLPHGIGGIGKTWLAQRCLEEARRAGWAAVEVDWGRADYRPSEPQHLMDAIASELKQVCGERAVRPYLETSTRARQVRERVKRYRQENQEKWQSIVESCKDIAVMGTGLARGEEVGKAAGKTVETIGTIVGRGAATLARAEDAFLDWLVERSKLKAADAALYRQPDVHLAKCLVDGLVFAAQRRPLVMLFDSCEVLSLRLEEWLRDAIVCPVVRRNSELLFIVCGLFNQYVGREVEDIDGNRRHVKGYADCLSDPPPISWDLARFADPEIAEYLEAHGLEPGDDLVALVQKLARGVPFAVQLVTVALCKLGQEQVRRDFPLEGHVFFSTAEIMTQVVRRFLHYCADETDRERVRALAVLRRPDEGVLRTVWGLEDGDSPRAVLGDLEARYGFVQVGGRLHDVVCEFLRDDLRGTEREWARHLGGLAVNYYRPLWEQATATMERLDERVADVRWRNLTHDLLNALCWGDEANVLPFAAARIIECMEFDWGFSRVLLKLTREFRTPPDWWTLRHQQILNLLTRVVEGEEEGIGLEELSHRAKELELDCAHRCILYLRQARYLYGQEKPREALAACFEAERWVPGDPSLRDTLADVFALVGWELGWKQGEAVASRNGLTAFNHAAILDSDDATSRYGLGAMLARQNRYQEAIVAFQKAIELDPTYAPPHNGLGNVYCDLGRREEAVAAYGQAIELDPTYAPPHNNLGNVLRNLGRHEEAIAAYQQAIELDPTYARPHNGLGSIHFDLGRHEEAIAAYQRAVELDVTYASPHNGLGNVLRNLGRHEEAIAAYQKAIKLDPNFSYAHIGLAGAYRHRGDEPQSQHHLAEAHRLIEPDDYAALACLHSIAGNVDAALEHLAKALEKAPGDRAWARHDPDLAFIRDDPRFRALVGEMTADHET